MPSFLLCLLIKESMFNLLQTPCHQLHFFFVSNRCCGQHFFMTNCYILHLLHHSIECALNNCEVLLQSLQSLPCFLLLLLSPFQLMLNLMEFLIQLFLNKYKPYIIFFPFLVVGFKLQGINPMLNTPSFIQYYTLKMLQL